MKLNIMDKININVSVKQQITPVASNLELAINNGSIKNDHIVVKLDSSATTHFF